MTKREKFIYVLKHYGYITLLAISAILIMIAVIVSATKDNVAVVDNTQSVQEVSAPVISFGLPVYNATVSKNFNNKELQYNETLKQFEAHLGMDFVTEANANVYAVLDGTVTEVGNSFLKGNYVVITHNNGLKTEYSSLNDNVAVTSGELVKKGTIIGTVGASAYGEVNEGAHLHFELLDGDKKIDPAGYLDIEAK